MTNKEIADVIDAVAAVAAGAAAPLAAVGGAPAIIVSVVAVALKSAASLVRAGKDAVEEIKRIHDDDPMLKSVRGEWSKFISEHFPKPSEPPVAKDEKDPYDGSE